MTTSDTVPSLADEVRDLFPARRGYLNSATCGLPPNAALDDLHRVLGEWRDGLGGPDEWDPAVQECRALFGRLVGAAPEHVAVGSQTAAMAGVVAASLPAGSTVLVAEEDFTSLTWPFLAQAERGIAVRAVPLEGLLDAVDDAVDWIAVSAAQSSSGALVDLAGLRAAAARHGARVLLDATQAAGWLPLRAADYDVVVASGYKWLLNPRGTCFTALRPDVLPLLRPALANWYAGEDVPSSYYGPPLRLAADARRLDLSPAWFCWAGAVAGLRLLAELGVERVHAHDVGLADDLLARLDLPPAGSAIVSVAAGDEQRARLAAAGLTVAGRAGRVRLSFHLYNDTADVTAAADCLRS